MTPKETLTNLFNDIADAIREKDGTSAEIVANTFPARIRAIPTGIGGVQLESIAITAPPYRTNYVAGEIFDPTGMAVYATYSNGQTMYVNHSNLTFDPSGPLEEGTTSITVNFQWGLKMVSATQPIVIIYPVCFGVMWDYSDESPALTRLTPETDPNGYVTATVSQEPSPATGNGPGSSPFDDFMPWSGMDEYNIVDGNVSYKKGETGFSRENDTVVYIPEFWYDCIDNEAESKRYWYVSDLQFGLLGKHPGSNKYISKYKVSSGGISKTGVKFQGGKKNSDAKLICTAKGTGFHLYTLQVLSAIQILYLVEFAHWDSQAKIGGGVFSNSSYIDNGASDDIVYHTGKASDAEWPQIKYREIEGIFGNALDMLDNFKSQGKYLFVSEDGVSYHDVGLFVGSTSGGSSPLYSIKELFFDDRYKYAFLPKQSVSNSPNNYIPDSSVFSTSGSLIEMCVGGYYVQNYNGGLFNYYASSGGSVNYGFRYIFDPEEKTEEVV